LVWRQCTVYASFAHCRTKADAPVTCAVATMPGSQLILAGDIGGTNSRFVLYEAVVAPGAVAPDEVVGNNKMLYSNNYKNAPFATFNDVLAQFIRDAGITAPIVAGCLAVAGPVVKDRVTFTNVGWVIAARELETIFGIKTIRLVNDFVANGYGTLTLDDSECVVLQEGKEDRSAPIGVIGAGTGLGEVFMTPRGGDGVYEAWPSEGGHVEFAPRNELEFECLQFIKKKLNGRVSVERVVSGTGLVNVYEFLRSKFPQDIVARYDDEIMRETKEGGALIGKHSADDQLCKQSLAFMLESYGAETGNLGLKFMPYGGLYIAGGIITKVLHHVQKEDSAFMKAFRDKGRLSTALYDIPLKVVLANDLGIRGAHVVANREMYASDSSVQSPDESAMPFAAASDESKAMFLIGAAALVAGAFAFFKSA